MYSTFDRVLAFILITVRQVIYELLRLANIVILCILFWFKRSKSYSFMPSHRRNVLDSSA